uniref:Uncharacterized protein n=1 Tax=Opuntia streptacantha TaxID=393608 RepID=A0A7C9AEZ9_OPUST
MGMDTIPGLQLHLQLQDYLRQLGGKWGQIHTQVVVWKSTRFMSQSFASSQGCVHCSCKYIYREELFARGSVHKSSRNSRHVIVHFRKRGKLSGGRESLSALSCNCWHIPSSGIGGVCEIGCRCH